MNTQQNQTKHAEAVWVQQLALIKLKLIKAKSQKPKKGGAESWDQISRFSFHSLPSTACWHMRVCAAYNVLISCMWNVRSKTAHTPHLRAPHLYPIMWACQLLLLTFLTFAYFLCIWNLVRAFEILSHCAAWVLSYLFILHVFVFNLNLITF